KEDAAVEAAIAGAQMDIPDAMVETQQRQMVDDFAQRLRMQGMNLDLYCQYTGQTMDSMLESVKPQALKRIQSRLVLEAVAAAEGIEASEEDFEKEIARMAEAYKMEADKVKEIMGENGKKQIMEDLAVSRAADFLRDNAVEVEKAE
ncbi:MAG TPA: trigger factor, partial [Candidatus Eisenbergiella stercorigallinarum]|nr:trigger factor [Candidatus Eisenbergiella stercorigallinarum]